MRRSWILLAGVAAALVLVSGTVFYRWWHNRPPFGPDDIRATATLQLFETAQAQKVYYLGVGGVELLADPGAQMVRGGVTWKPPRVAAGGWFTLLLIDKRIQRKPPQISGAAPSGSRVSNRVAERYPWLRGAGDIIEGPDTARSGGMSLTFSPDAADVSFLALFPPLDKRAPLYQSDYATAPVRLDNLLLALVFIGPDRQVYWAQRLYG
jgi:hypothetical protein